MAQTELFNTTQCKFVMAWIGRCKNVAPEETAICSEHAEKRCGTCQRQAVSDCPETMGPMVCGRLTCGACTHSHRMW
jgi:hypothetical protein